MHISMNRQAPGASRVFCGSVRTCLARGFTDRTEGLRKWRDSPCFHAGLPPGLVFFCAALGFFFARTGEKNRPLYAAPNLRLNRANKSFLSAQNGVSRRFLRSPRCFFGSKFPMPALSKKRNSRHAQRKDLVLFFRFPSLSAARPQIPTRTHIALLRMSPGRARPRAGAFGR